MTAAAGAMPQLEFTGERVVPGLTPEITFREHQMRYAFAAQFVAGRTVLDVACGSGLGADYLRRAGARVCFGLDLDWAALACARSHFRLRSLAACDAIRLCLKTRSVEVIVSFETIEHLADPAAFLAECARVLTAGGLLICSSPNRDVSQWDRNPFHVAEMSVKEFCRRVGQQFEECRLFAQRAVPYPLHVARRSLGGVLDTLRLKSWVRRCLRMRVDTICREVEFADANFDERYAVSPVLPRWPYKPRYAIVVARKPR